jgi:hypothetical protein
MKHVLYLVLVLVGTGRAFSPVIARAHHNAAANPCFKLMLQTLVNCVDHPCFQITALTFEFWFDLRLKMFQGTSVTPDKSVALQARRTVGASFAALPDDPASKAAWDPAKDGRSKNGKQISKKAAQKLAENQNLYSDADRLAMEPYFHRLASICIKSTTYPENFVNMPYDVQDDFRHKFRNDTRDTLRIVVSGVPLTNDNVSSAGLMLQAIHKTLATYVTESSNNNNHGGGWKPIEANIHAATAIAGYVRPEDEQTVLGIVSCVTQLALGPVSHRELLCTACLFIRMYSTWINAHPVVFESVFNILMRSLTIPEGSNIYDMREGQDHVAAVSLMRLNDPGKIKYAKNTRGGEQKNQRKPGVQPFSSYMITKFAALQGLYESLLPQMEGKAWGGSRKTLAARSRLLIVSATTSSLNALQSPEDAAKAFATLFNPAMAIIRMLVSKHPDKPLPKPELEEVVQQLNVVRYMLGNCRNNQLASVAVELVFKEHWPVFQALFKRRSLRAEMISFPEPSDPVITTICRMVDAFFELASPSPEVVSPVLNLVLGDIIGLFKKTYDPHCLHSLLTIGRWIGHLGSNPTASLESRQSCTQGLTFIFNQSTEVMFSLFRGVDLDQPLHENFPEDKCFGMIYEWFTLLSMSGDLMPAVMASEDVIAVALEFTANVGLKAKEKRAATAALKFVSDVIRWHGEYNTSTDCKKLATVIYKVLAGQGRAPLGPVVMHALFMGIWGSLPHFILNRVMDTMWNLWQMFGVKSTTPQLQYTLFFKWLVIVLQQPLKGSSDKKKQAFLRDFTAAAQMNKAKAKRVLKCFCGGKKYTTGGGAHNKKNKK